MTYPRPLADRIRDAQERRAAPACCDGCACVVYSDEDGGLPDIDTNGCQECPACCQAIGPGDDAWYR